MCRRALSPDGGASFYTQSWAAAKWQKTADYDIANHWKRNAVSDPQSWEPNCKDERHSKG